MLRLAGARLLDERDRLAVRAMLTADPVASCMVASRTENLGMDPWRLGGELWGCEPRGFRGGRLDSLCFAGSNLIEFKLNMNSRLDLGHTSP